MEKNSQTDMFNNLVYQRYGLPNYYSPNLFIASMNGEITTIFFAQIFDLMTGFINMGAVLFNQKPKEHMDLNLRFSGFDLKENLSIVQHTYADIEKKWKSNNFKDLAKFPAEKGARLILNSWLVHTPIKSDFAKTLFGIGSDDRIFLDVARSALENVRAEMVENFPDVLKIQPDMEDLEDLIAQFDYSKPTFKLKLDRLLEFKEILHRILKQDPFAPTAWILLIMIEISLGEFESAKECLRFALAVDSFYPPFWMLAINFNKAKKRWKKPRK